MGDLSNKTPWYGPTRNVRVTQGGRTTTRRAAAPSTRTEQTVGETVRNAVIDLMPSLGLRASDHTPNPDTGERVITGFGKGISDGWIGTLGRLLGTYDPTLRSDEELARPYDEVTREKRAAINSRREDELALRRGLEGLNPTDSIADTVGEFAGQVGAGAVSDPTTYISPGASPLARIGSQMAIGGLNDLAIQGLETMEDRQDDIDWRQVAMNAGIGLVTQGIGEGVRFANGADAPEVRADEPDVIPEALPEVAPEAPRPTRRQQIQEATRNLSDVEPGGFKTVRPFEADEPDYYRFRHVTGDGQEVTGTYTFDPESGVIDNFSINSKEGANAAGPAAIRRLSRQLQDAHPDANAVRAYRTTGARSAEEFVDIPLRRSGGGAEPPRSGPPNGDEPMGPGRDPEKYVGNINLDRLNSTEDVANLLRTVQEDVGPLERQSHAETRQKADGLEMDEEDFLQSRGLQGLEAQALRARDILKTVAEDTVRVLDDFDDLESPEAQLAIARLGAVSEHVQHTINGPAGRILNSFKINADSVNAANTLTGALATPRGRARVKKLLEQYRNDPDALAKIARDAVNPTVRDFIFSVRYNMMLSSPKTHVYNIAGTSGHLLADMATRGLSAVIDIPRGMSGGTDVTTGREVAARIIGLVKGAADSLDNVKQAFAEGRPLDDASRMDMKRGRTGRWELPVKLMSATDEFFRSASHMSSVYGAAVRDAVKEGHTGDDLLNRIQELIENPTKKMLDEADDYAKLMRFQDTPSAFGQAVEQMRVHKKGDAPLTSLGRDGLSLLLPFIRTPDSLARTAIRYSPLGILERRNWEGLKAGGAERSLAISRIALGTGLATMTALKVLEGTITGEGPRDYKARQQLELAGWQPKSIKVGDKYYSYEGMEPLAYILSGVATTMERWDEGSAEGFWDQAGNQIFNFAEVLTNSQWTEGLSDFFKVLNAPEAQRGAAIDNFFANIASSFVVPAASRAVNQSFFDPITRDTRGDDSMSDRVINRIQAGIPGLSDNLPAQLDALGRPIGHEYFGPDILSRISSPLAQSEPVVDELARIGAPIERVDKSLNTKDFPMGRLTALEQHNYQLVTGTYFTAIMEEAIASPDYQGMDDEQKRAYVKKAATQAREWAREEVFSDPDEEEGNEASNEASNDATTTRPEAEGDEFAFGVPTRMRSTPGHNKAVGGVPGSAHLDGDAIDYVPADGVTFAELYRQAKAFFGPGATILWEDRGTDNEHVHVKVPQMGAPYYSNTGAP